MKTTILKVPIALCAAFSLAGCGQADMNDPRGSSITPQQVTVREVKNYHGYSVIKYDMPDDLNLKYVRGVYHPRRGWEADVNASFFADSIIVEGFAQAGSYEVQLYSVGYTENLSEPVKVTVEPLTPPYLEVFGTLDMIESFGGLYVTYENEYRGNVTITVAKKEQGLWMPLYSHYTSLADGNFAVRGQDAVEAEYGVYVSDRWGNTTEIESRNLTPWFEEKCDKTLFRKMTLPTDSYVCHSWNEVTRGNDMTKLWDDILYADPCFQSLTTDVMPQWFTFDMGREYQLSRFVMHGRYYDNNNFSNIFRMGHARKFNIWGSNDPNPDGSFDDSWTLISYYESFRPSGATEPHNNVVANIPDEDKAVGLNGEEFMIPEGTPSFRYIRFHTLETWSKVVYVHMNELTFYGQQVD